MEEMVGINFWPLSFFFLFLFNQIKKNVLSVLSLQSLSLFWLLILGVRTTLSSEGADNFYIMKMMEGTEGGGLGLCQMPGSFFFFFKVTYLNIYLFKFYWGRNYGKFYLSTLLLAVGWFSYRSD